MGIRGSFCSTPLSASLGEVLNVPHGLDPRGASLRSFLPERLLTLCSQQLQGRGTPIVGSPIAGEGLAGYVDSSFAADLHERRSSQVMCSLLVDVL
jgi:hypothetical protein